MANTADKVSARVFVYGRVQGVGFRDFAYRGAQKESLTGYVKNLSDGRTVEVYAEGTKTQLEKLISQLKTGPRMAVVEKLTTDYGDAAGSYTNFEIRY
ncbi:MAG: acylphosphatase [Dehalococcoidales bacterium]